MTDTPVIGVVGLGTMGLGIAQVYAQAGFPVRATDLNADARDGAKDRLRDALKLRVAAGRMEPAAMAATLKGLTIVSGPGDLGPAAMIVEAIAERMDAKQALFRQLESVAPGAVLATNTSSLSVTAMARGVDRPDRVVGLHFFNPASAMRLVELIAQPESDPQALRFARQATQTAGKTVIPCPDRPGFIVNRCARPFYGEALALLEEERTASDVDAAMLAAGYRTGPLSLIDLIGADINLAATEGISSALDRHPRYHVFQTLRDQVARGDLGRKSGRGFLFPGTPGAAPPDAHEIALRIEAALVNEAGWLLAEGGVAQGDIDTAMKLGLNLPRGPFEILAAEGPQRILSTLARLQADAPPHLKGRYLPAPVPETA